MQLLRLVTEVQPDLLHSHFVTNTLLMRCALGPKNPLPRIFQVPGPLHLEHALHRRVETALAGPNDYWIASSRYIASLYARTCIDFTHLFLSYYGVKWRSTVLPRSGWLRTRLGLGQDAFLIGNVNFIYPPKYWLGQRRGLKGHEDLIAGLGLLLGEKKEAVGVVIGATFGGAGRYERRLRGLAERIGQGRIVMTGHLAPEEVVQAYPDLDCCVHVPNSENCGGVIEPLLAGVPVVAAATGGIPEVIVDQVTGKLLPGRSPQEIYEGVLAVMNQREHYARLTTNGRRLAQMMFDPARTAKEVAEIYGSVLGGSRPKQPCVEPGAYRDAAHG